MLNERMAEAEKSRTALVLELERVELEAQGEVHSLDSASEGSSAAAKAALERQRAAAQALRRKLKMKDAQLAQYVEVAHSSIRLELASNLAHTIELTSILNRFNQLALVNFVKYVLPVQATQAAWRDLAVL